MKVKRVMIIISCLALIAVVKTSAFANWSVTYLTPTGYNYSKAWGVSDGLVVGEISINDSGSNPYHAAVWNGKTGSWIDINPTGAFDSYANAICNGRIVGYVRGMSSQTEIYTDAALWNRITNSWIDLNPVGANSSFAYGVSDTQEVGFTYISDLSAHASLWSGSAASWVDLNPEQCLHSTAYAVSGNQQVGYSYGTVTNRYNHASLWNGTAESWIDLNPSVAAGGSEAHGVSNNKQVGYVRINPTIQSYCASLWSGTAESWVNLHPTLWKSSKANAICNDKEVGYVYDTIDKTRAGIWSGTADSFINLHDYLGPIYTSSSATSIDVQGDDVWVSGMAYNSNTKNYEAVLWHYTIPEPSSFFTLFAALSATGLICRKSRNTRR